MVRNLEGDVLDLKLRSDAGSKRKSAKAKVKTRGKPPHNDTFLNLKKEKIEAQPLGEGQAGNGIPSPETHIDSVPQPAHQGDHRQDRKADDVVSRLTSANKQDSVLPERSAASSQEDRKEVPNIQVTDSVLPGSGDQASRQDRKEDEDISVWGAVAALIALLISIVGIIYLWWKNRKEGDAA